MTQSPTPASQVEIGLINPAPQLSRNLFGGPQGALQAAPKRKEGSLLQILLEQTSQRTCTNPSHDIERWTDLWREWCDRPCPAARVARSEFTRTLIAENDLSPRQARDMVARIVLAKSTAGTTREWLGALVQRFLHYVRPWFPIWRAYISWAMHWCISHGHQEICFLCRDTLPLYVLGRRMLLTGEVLSADVPPALRLLHASRKLVASPYFSIHFASTFPSLRALALVDTGCYGSLMPKLINLAGPRSSKQGLAILFFFSRNPNIFGYMNYLMAWENLDLRHSAHTSRSLFDFVIYAGDMLEAQPKAYRVERFGENGTPEARPQDLVTFVLACALLADLDKYVSTPAGRQCFHRDEAHRAAIHLWTFFQRDESDPAKRDALLFTAPAPKVVPESTDYLRLHGLPPQDEIFGSVSG